MSQLGSYSKLYAIGHNLAKDIFVGDVLIEEKIDGSQFSFGIHNGDLLCRSKGVELDLNNPEKMFNKAIETVQGLAPFLTDGWTYRAEYLQKPKHNTLAYDRIPVKHLMVFDIDKGNQNYLSYDEKKAECDRLGLEVVPFIFSGQVTTIQTLTDLLDRVSILGGQKIEGIVVKNYSQYSKESKILMAKHVSEGFKEVHQGDWRDRNPAQSDILTVLISNLKTPARKNKAVQHLKEAGKLTGSPSDIGLIIKEVQKDTIEEEKEYIKEQLYNWAVRKIERGIVSDVPQWYKDELLKAQFGA